MTYRPPPNRNWQPPPPPPPSRRPQPQRPGQPGAEQVRPPLPVNLVVLGILAVVLSGACFLHGGFAALVPMLVALVGGVLVFVRQQASVLVLAVASGLTILMTLCGILSRVGIPLFAVSFRIEFDVNEDWFDAVRLILAVVVLVLALNPRTKHAFAGVARPRPDYGPRPNGYGPPPGQQPPQGWR